MKTLGSEQWYSKNSAYFAHGWIPPPAPPMVLQTLPGESTSTEPGVCPEHLCLGAEIFFFFYKGN